MDKTRVRAGQIKGVAKQYAASIESITPSSFQPNENSELIVVKGEFFNPDTVITSDGGEVTNSYFVSTKEMRFKMIAGNQEGAFSITVDNGIDSTINNSLLISLGEVTPLIPEDTVLVSGTGDISLEKIEQLGEQPFSNQWLSVPNGQNFQIRFQLSRSPLYPDGNSGDYKKCLVFYDTSDGSEIASIQLFYQGSRRLRLYGSENDAYGSFNYQGLQNVPISPVIIVEKIDNIFSLKDLSGAVQGASYTIPDEITGDIKIEITAFQNDFVGVKHIKLN